MRVLLASCSRNKKPVATPQPTPTLPAAPEAPPAPPHRVEDAPIAQPRLGEDGLADRSMDDLNRKSPLKPVFFVVDSADLDDGGRSIATANAEVLKKNPSATATRTTTTPGTARGASRNARTSRRRVRAFGTTRRIEKRRLRFFRVFPAALRIGGRRDIVP